MSALIVEDGTRPDGANCFISLADADIYLVARGLWEATPMIENEDVALPSIPDPVVVTKKERAIILACDWINTLKFKGSPIDIEQILAFPRLNIQVAETVVPRAVGYANAKLAVYFFNEEDVFAPKERGIIEKEEKVDVLEERTLYSETAPNEVYYRDVVELLRPYLSYVEGDSNGNMLGVMNMVIGR